MLTFYNFRRFSKSEYSPVSSDVDENREVVLVLGLLVASLKICSEEARGLKLGRVISELHLVLY